MKKLFLVVLLITGMSVLVASYLTYNDNKSAKTDDISNFQNEVKSKAENLNVSRPIHDSHQSIWLPLFEGISGQYSLQITIKESNFQQAEISVEEAPFDDMVDAFAELYAQGIRFQSIRLLKTDTPGMVRADTIRLINSN